MKKLIKKFFGNRKNGNKVVATKTPDESRTVIIERDSNNNPVGKGRVIRHKK